MNSSKIHSILKNAMISGKPAFEGASMLTVTVNSSRRPTQMLSQWLLKNGAVSHYNARTGNLRYVYNLGTLRFVVEISLSYRVTVHFEDQDWYNPAPAYWAC